MRALSVFLACLLFAFAVQAAAQSTELNGKGIRKRLFFEVYEISLFLPKRTASADEALAQPGSKRIEIRMLRDVGADQFTDALAQGIKDNHGDAEAQAFEPRVKQLAMTMAEIKEAKKGMLITLEWTGKETQLGVDGKPAGKPIEGEDFYRALLRIWLGPRPVQDDLKKALLGGS